MAGLLEDIDCLDVWSPNLMTRGCLAPRYELQL